MSSSETPALLTTDMLMQPVQTEVRHQALPSPRDIDKYDIRVPASVYNTDFFFDTRQLRFLYPQPFDQTLEHPRWHRSRDQAARAETVSGDP